MVKDAINTMDFFKNLIPGYLGATADTDTGYNYSDVTVHATQSRRATFCTSSHQINSPAHIGAVSRQRAARNKDVSRHPFPLAVISVR